MTAIDINPLIKKSKRALKSANLLFNDGDNDSSVSRTYYALHYATEAVLLTMGIKIKSHKGLISEFGKHFVITNIFPKLMGTRLHNIFDKRLIGDYDYASTISKNDAEQALKDGQELIDKIIEY